MLKNPGVSLACPLEFFLGGFVIVGLQDPLSMEKEVDSLVSVLVGFSVCVCSAVS